MARWEFHLSDYDSNGAARWIWLYRGRGIEAVTSKTAFATYCECVADALEHGYDAPVAAQSNAAPRCRAS